MRLSRPLRLLRLPPALVQAAIALAAVLLTLWSQTMTAPASSFFASEWLRDRFIGWHAVSTKEPRILLVDINDDSLAELGPWPWPRERIASLVEILLTHYSARGVALDIVMADPADAIGDQRLALLAKYGAVVLAQAFDYNTLRPSREGVPTAPGARRTAGAVAATGYRANHALFASAAHVGNIGFVPDSDGVLRRLPLLTAFGGANYPTLALALLDCCAGGTPLTLPAAGLTPLRFTRDWSAYTVVTAAEILDQRIEPDSASERLVVIGSSAFGLGDRVATPLAANRPGLWVHGAMLSDLLDLQAGKTASSWPGPLLACLYAVAVAALTMFMLARRSALACLAALVGSALLWVACAFVISTHDATFVTTGPLASILLLLAVAVPFQWQLTQRRSRYLLDTLRQYVAPEVVAQLLRSDITDPLAPRQCDVTTLIADMEGYTTQVESLPVEEASRLTRDFLDCLTGPVIAHQGTLDKYTGDGLVAFWGAPLPNANHADLALDAARQIVQRVKLLGQQRQREGKAGLRVRIGIDSGLAMAGDFGTSFRSIYTAVGDSVNTASRLEQAAREFPYDVIVGAGTVERAQRHRFVALGERRLRGKEKPTALYALAIDDAGDTHQSQQLAHGVAA